MEKDIITCGIEVPKENNRKFEIQKNTLYHPFMQDTKINAVTSNVELRYYPQYSLFNYGFIPQTWEQNINADAEGYFGDNDPVDICDLSSKPMPIG
jgi:inorganic pyrophosphatase